MQNSFEHSSEPIPAPPAPAPRQQSWVWVMLKALGCISGGVGLGLLVFVGVVSWLLYVAAPAALDWITRIGS